MMNNPACHPITKTLCDFQSPGTRFSNQKRDRNKETKPDINPIKTNIAPGWIK